MTLTELPARFVVGDTVTWDETLSDYPASSSWVVTYYFSNHNTSFSSGHAASGDDHTITITTTDLEAGDYDYQKVVTDGASRFTLERGRVTVEPDLSGDDESGEDRRSYAERALANIEAVLIGKATRDQSSYSLNGRALSRYSPDELRAWRASLRIELREEKARVRRRAGGKSHANVRVRFKSGAI